ncbi:MAG TPA: filamentous hemagglutinin N-terminal domain-containing protein, partial [Caulobacteraceae bacterium]|nr:filamentous hemagglutinin N-terminal domain-containing protein [Caulobacteraceae bacterium]
MADLNSASRRFGHHSRLLASSAPLALAIAIGAGPTSGQQARPVNIPFPTAVNPANGLRPNWTHVTTDAGYDPHYTTGSVTQTAPRAYAEWESFNVTPGSTWTVNGQQPDWILVDRVVGVNGVIPASSLSGMIAANGQVWILNTSGIAVSKTGVLDVAGLLLSTAASFNLTGDGAATPGSFLGGSLAFQFGGAANSVVMDGTVNASKGIVAFLAPQVTVGGKVVQTGGSTQFVAVAAQDVSLVFTDVGTVLALDGVTISAPAPVQCINVCPPPPHSTVDLQAGSQITAGRIFVAGAAVGSPAAIIASGGLTATAARGDGQDIVLMAADNVVAGTAPSAELAGGAVQASATTTTTGGSVTIDTALVNTTAAGVEDPAAAVGAGLMIRSAGDTDVGGITNAAGDIDILARNNINSLTSGGGNMAGVDIALDGGTVTVGALTAGDDVAVRAAQFSATSIASGQSVAGQAPVDTIGAADRLIASAGAFTLAGVYYDLTGHDIDIIAPAGIAVTGPITAAPATSGFLSSDVRLEALDGVSVANITADRDILVIAGLRAGSVTGGAFTAGRDVAVWVHPGAGSIALASAEAGDDIVLRSPTAITVTGGLTTQGLDVSPAVAGDQAGDLLSSLLPMTAFGHAFTVSPGSQVDLIAGTTIDIGAAATAAGPNSSARFQAKDGVTVGAVTAGADVLIDADLTDADSGAAVGAVAKGALSAGRDIAVRSTNADISLLSATAGDDIVLRSTLAIDVTGALATLGLDVSPATAADQAGDLLSAADPITAFGHVFDLTGSDIDVKSGAGGTDGAISIGGQIAAAGAQSDVRLQADNAITVAGVSAGRDILIDGDLTDGNGDQGSGVTGGALVAGRDVGVRSLNNSVTLASAQAGDDIVLRSPTASITVSGTLAAGGVDVTPASSADQAGDLLSGLDPMTAFGFKFAASPGSEIDVLAATTISVGGQSSGAGAQSDARFQANDGIALGGVSVGRDILIDGDLTDAGAPAGVTAGALVAGRDIAVQSLDSAVTLASAQSGDHLVLRAVGAIDITGALTTGGANAAPTADQAGNLLVASDPMVAFGHTFALAGSDIDVVAGGAITVGGPAAAAGALSDARFQTANGVTLAAVNAGADVLVDGGGAVVGGALVAGRDVGVQSLGFSIALASAQAGDDIVLRAPTVISVSGGLTTNGQDVSPKTSPDQAGDLLAALDPLNAFGATFPVSPGSDIDVVAGDGVKIAGQVAAAGSQSDARFQGPIVTLAGITAGEDVFVDGGLFATVGAVSAGRDVGIAAGADLTLASAQAGDDIVLRAGDNLTVTGSLTTLGQDAPVAKAANQAGDLLAAFEPMTAFGASFAVSPGSDIDVMAGFPITVGGQVTAGGPKSSARFQSGYGVSLAGVTAGQDILIDADSSDLEGGTPTGVIAAALIAGRDIGIRSQLSSITLASAQAGDDIVLRSPSTIDVTSSLATTGPDSTPAVSPDQAGDLLSALDPMKAFGATFSVSPGSDIDVVAGGAIAVGGAATAAGALSDARFQSPLSVTLAGVNAGEDLLIDGGGAVIGGIMVAGRDIAVRSLDSSLALISAQAVDDIVLRSATSVGVTGTLASQGLDTTGTTTPDQAGVLLATLEPMVAFGHTFTLTGSDIDAVAGTTISVGGQTTGTGALADARFQANDAITLGGVTVGRDILIDADLTDAGTFVAFGVVAGVLDAGRDVGVQSPFSTVTLASAQAADDIVLRSASTIRVTGALTTGGADVSPKVAPDQAGDLLAAADPLKAFGATFSVSPGSDIDVVAGGAIAVGGAVTAAGALSDARFQSPLAVTLGNVSAGEDLLVDGGGAVIGGIMVAGRDIAVRSLDSSLALISAQAGDDIVLRSATSVGVTGTLASQGLDTTGTTTPDQAGVLLAT